MTGLNDAIQDALAHLNVTGTGWTQREPLPLAEFLRLAVMHPETTVRNVFQLFRDMIRSHVSRVSDEYSEDPEAISFVSYDCHKLLVEGTDHPFFADRLFANRLVMMAEALTGSAQQNKIYVFEGPPGSGKSTFLNNIVQKFENYVNTDRGLLYEAVWRIDRHALGDFSHHRNAAALEKLAHMLEEHEISDDELLAAKHTIGSDDYLEIACPSHDHPLLIIPREPRRQFLEDLFRDDELKWRMLSEEMEYEWLFQRTCCTICSSIYEALLSRLKHPSSVLSMLFARPYCFNRRLGVGISIFNPGDRPGTHLAITNDMVQGRINELLKDSNRVRYVYSRFAPTNNGVYALMDVKGHNTARLIELHNIVSEGVHKVEDMEENVNSLFFVLLNPEDRKKIEKIESFYDRVESIKIPYILDLNTEVEIYRTIFGKHIDQSFLPRVLHNFARIIISSRMSPASVAMHEWIPEPQRYSMYCDFNLQLLKMEIYTGHIPQWLTEEDRKLLTARRWRKIIAESETEGHEGFSGRDAIRIFGEFYAAYARKDGLITMTTLVNFFTKVQPELAKQVPSGLIDSVVRMYNFTVLQEVKGALYYYNEEQIARDIQNYLFAISYETGTTATATYTGDRLMITDAWFEEIEKRLLGEDATKEQRLAFRHATQKEYASATLAQEILAEGKPVQETKLYRELFDRYTFNLKEKALDRFLENENFRTAIKDFGKEEFKSYDKRIREDVTFLINNLGKKHRYTRAGAKEVCMYVIDNDLAKQFAVKKPA